MRYSRKVTMPVAAAGAVLAILAGAMGPAFAEPPAGVTPAAGDIVGVGAEATEMVTNNYATAYNATNPAHKVYGWDAVGSSPIVTKAGCPGISRPNGTNAGLTALNNDPAAYNQPGVCVDFVRGNRYPDATRATDIDKTFIAYGKDLVTWAAIPVSPKQTPRNLTTAQLKAIYLCTLTDWHVVNPLLPSHVIEPYLPQSGAAIRSTFLRAMNNNSDANGVNPELTPGACVRQPATLQQNSGVSLQAYLQAGDTIGAALVPYSAGNWVAQSRGTVADPRNGMTVREIDGSAATIPDVAQGVAGPYSLNPDGKFKRLLFNVVKNQPGSTGLDKIWSQYVPMFGKNGYICTHPLTAKDGYISLPTSGTGMLCGTKLGIS